MRKLTLALLAGALLTACGAPQIHYAQLAALDKGLTPAEVTSKLRLEPTARHTAQADGRSFQFYQYRMNNGIQSDHYLVAFEGDQVVYWGYMDEMRKHPDKAISAAAGQIVTAVAVAR